MISFVTYFLRHFLGALYIFLGRAWAEGKGELQRAACRLAEVEVRAVDSSLIALIYVGRTRLMNKKNPRGQTAGVKTSSIYIFDDGASLIAYDLVRS